MPLDLEMVIALAFTLLMTLVIGGIILLRPIAKHLGEFLEAKAKEGKALGNRGPEDWDRLFATLEGLATRVESLEERQEFTERLLASPRKEDLKG